MLSENDLQIILWVYLCGALVGWCAWWMLTRWVWPHFIRGQLRAILLVVLVAPSPATEGGALAAPAWAVLALDFLNNGAITRQDALQWIQVFAAGICGWALIWAIGRNVVNRRRKTKDLDQELEQRRQQAAAKIDEQREAIDSFMMSPAAPLEPEIEETPMFGIEDTPPQGEIDTEETEKREDLLKKAPAAAQGTKAPPKAPTKAPPKKAGPEKAKKKVVKKGLFQKSEPVASPGKEKSSKIAKHSKKPSKPKATGV